MSWERVKNMAEELRADAPNAPPSRPERSWPEPLDDAALHGVAGSIVRAIDPHTESDMVAVLGQLLVVIGNRFGRGPGWRVAPPPHHCNLNAALVGNTAKARKGTSLGQAVEALRRADPEFVWESGLSSGEGLIAHVRDARTTRQKAKTSDENLAADLDGYVEVEVDPGVSDKRLVVFESELSSVLERMQRKGNTLPEVLMLAWDGDPLRTMVKTDPHRATGAHVSLIGHITEEQLRRKLTDTDAASGFGNRWMWLCVRRSKELPFGGRLHTVDWRPMVDKLRLALEHAHEVTFARTPEGLILREEGLGFTPAAADKWEAVYSALSGESPGMFGAITARAEATVRRLAVIYAVLDCYDVVDLSHLDAALALWDYSERSCRYLFGSALGDPDADTILAALKRAGVAGMSRTEIRDLFGRNKSTTEIDRALAVLLERKLAAVERVAAEGPGRPTERWRAA